MMDISVEIRWTGIPGFGLTAPVGRIKKGGGAGDLEGEGKKKKKREEKELSTDNENNPGQSARGRSVGCDI